MLSENERRYNAKRAAAPHTGAAALLSCFYPFRAFREQFRQLSTALRRRSPGSLLLLLNRLHRGVWQDSALFSSNRLQQHPQNWRSSSGTVRQAPTLSTKVVHSFVHDPFSKGLDGNWDGLCGRLLNVTIRDVLHCPTEENISVILHPDLTLRAVRSAKQSWMPSSFLGSLLRTHPL